MWGAMQVDADLDDAETERSRSEQDKDDLQRKQSRFKCAPGSCITGCQPAAKMAACSATGGGNSA